MPSVEIVRFLRYKKIQNPSFSSLPIFSRLIRTQSGSRVIEIKKVLTYIPSLNTKIRISNFSLWFPSTSEIIIVTSKASSLLKIGIGGVLILILILHITWIVLLQINGGKHIIQRTPTGLSWNCISLLVFRVQQLSSWNTMVALEVSSISSPFAQITERLIFHKLIFPTIIKLHHFKSITRSFTLKI